MGSSVRMPGTIFGFSEAVALVGTDLEIDGMIANAHTAGSAQSSVPASGAVAGLLAAACPPVTTCYSNGPVIS